MYLGWSRLFDRHSRSVWSATPIRRAAVIESIICFVAFTILILRQPIANHSNVRCHFSHSRRSLFATGSLVFFVVVQASDWLSVGSLTVVDGQRIAIAANPSIQLFQFSHLWESSDRSPSSTSKVS